MMRIVIVDDHVLFREGLAAILRQEPDIEVVGLFGAVQEAVASTLALKPDIVLMDYNLPDGTGADATRKILGNSRDVKSFLSPCPTMTKTLYPQSAAARWGT